MVTPPRPAREACWGRVQGGHAVGAGRRAGRQHEEVSSRPGGEPTAGASDADASPRAPAAEGDTGGPPEMAGAARERTRTLQAFSRSGAPLRQVRPSHGRRLAPAAVTGQPWLWARARAWGPRLRPLASPPAGGLPAWVFLASGDPRPRALQDGCPRVVTLEAVSWPLHITQQDPLPGWLWPPPRKPHLWGAPTLGTGRG